MEHTSISQEDFFIYTHQAIGRYWRYVAHDLLNIIKYYGQQEAEDLYIKNKRVIAALTDNS